MKFKKIVGFGDSWMWGDELLDPALIDHEYAHPVLIENTPFREGNCFLGQLGRHYNVPTENFGIAGGSLQSTIWTYLWWLEHETLPLDQCLVLVGLTEPNRHTFYNPGHVSYANDPPWNRFVHSAWINSGFSNFKQEWINMVKYHTVLTECGESNVLNYRQAVLFFQGQTDRTAGVLQFNTIRPPCRINEPTLLWPDLSLAIIMDKLPHRQHLLAPNRHPNVQGHEWIASRLIPEIDRATMSM